MPHTMAGRPRSRDPVDFAPVGKEALDVVERIRTLWMPGQFHLFPRAARGGHLFLQSLDAVMQLLDLALVSSSCPATDSSLTICCAILSSSCFDLVPDSIFRLSPFLAVQRASTIDTRNSAPVTTSMASALAEPTAAGALARLLMKAVIRPRFQSMILTRPVHTILPPAQ